jgi:hypothetical protein
MNTKEPIFYICPNPECPAPQYIPQRVNQVYCCTSCKNRANYLRNREMLKNRYADLTEMIKADKKLARLMERFPESKISLRDLQLMEIPVDAAMKIAKNETKQGKTHFFSNYGITTTDGNIFYIIKRENYGRPTQGLHQP